MRGGIVGTTLVPTMDGVVPIMSLSKGDNKVLSYVKPGRLGYVSITKMRRRKVNCLNLKLDDGSNIICYGDQRVYLIGMRPTRAEQLRVGIRLQVYYRHTTAQGYIKFSITKRDRKVPEHILIMETVIGRPIKSPQEQVHHEDENKANNIRSNLKFLSRSAHSSYHARGYRNPVYRIRDRITWAAKIAAKSRRPRNTMPIQQLVAIARTFESKYGMELSKRNWDKARKDYDLPVPTAGSIVSKYRFESFSAFKEAAMGDNHKVVEVTPLSCVNVVSFETEGMNPIYLANRVMMGVG